MSGGPDPICAAGLDPDPLAGLGIIFTMAAGLYIILRERATARLSAVTVVGQPAE